MGWKMNRVAEVKLETQMGASSQVLSVLDEVVPGLVKGRAAGEDVVDVIHGVRARVREKTNSSLFL